VRPEKFADARKKKKKNSGGCKYLVRSGEKIGETLSYGSMPLQFFLK